MSKSACEPAHSVIRKLGGEKLISANGGPSVETLWRWQRAREREGTGGVIPQKRWPEMFEAARRLSVPLTANELAGVTEDFRIAS